VPSLFPVVPQRSARGGRSAVVRLQIRRGRFLSHRLLACSPLGERRKVTANLWEEASLARRKENPEVGEEKKRGKAQTVSFQCLNATLMEEKVASLWREPLFFLSTRGGRKCETSPPRGKREREKKEGETSYHSTISHPNLHKRGVLILRGEEEFFFTGVPFALEDRIKRKEERRVAGREKKGGRRGTTSTVTFTFLRPTRRRRKKRGWGEK